MKTVIKLTLHEIQSNSSRVKFAEGLIAQLPPNHDGRNTWLLNYGIGAEAQQLQSKRENMIWDFETESLVSDQEKKRTVAERIASEVEAEKKENPEMVLIKETLGAQLITLDEVAKKCQREKDLMVAGYLIALGHTGYDEVKISPDYTFLTLIKKEKKEDGKGPD